MRIVLDTAVMVAALRSDSGASRQLLLGALQRRLTLLVSVPLIVEYESVLTRPDTLTASGLTLRQMNELLDAVAAVCEPVRLSFLWRPTLSDPNDDMVLETAVNGQADAIVTFNIRDFTEAARWGYTVALPGKMLKEIRRKS